MGPWWEFWPGPLEPVHVSLTLRVHLGANAYGGVRPRGSTGEALKEMWTRGGLPAKFRFLRCAYCPFHAQLRPCQSTPNILCGPKWRPIEVKCRLGPSGILSPSLNETNFVGWKLAMALWARIRITKLGLVWASEREGRFSCFSFHIRSKSISPFCSKKKNTLDF